MNSRFRAYLLFPADAGKFNEVVDRIRSFEKEMIKKELGNDFVFIRANEVESHNDLPVTFVAVVDAVDASVMNELTEQLPQHYMLSVTGDSLPSPPHVASGFITPGEFDADRESKHYKNSGGDTFAVLVEIGRQDHSPGFNPWG
jgi:hypothetical protein